MGGGRAAYAIELGSLMGLELLGQKRLGVKVGKVLVQWHDAAPEVEFFFKMGV